MIKLKFLVNVKNMINIKNIIIAAAGLILTIYLLIWYWQAEMPEWHKEAGYRWAKLPDLLSGRPGFRLLPSSETKITFSNSLTPDQIGDNRFLLGGSGVATGDIDGDGLVDVYFCSLDGSNVLYKNLGNWKFRDITQGAGVACLNRFSTGASFVDIDGDYDLDLLVTTLGGPNTFFINDGTGKFTEETRSAGLESSGGSTSMAFSDIDGDGDLDLYITNFKKKSVENIYSPPERAQHLVTKKVGDTFEVQPKFKEHYRVEMIGEQPFLFENAEPDFLYINDGQGHFNLASFTDGRFLDEEGKPVSELKDWGLLVRFQDMDNDGDPDIYVCNDFWSPDRIWINDGTGRFKAISKLSIRHTSKFTMGVDFSDIDRDGDLDFLLMDMLPQEHGRRLKQMGAGTSDSPPTEIGQISNRPQIKRNTLFMNRGDNTYAEIGQISGVQASEWTWSILFLDIDLDGYEDILATNGQLYDFEDTDTNNRVQRLLAMGLDYHQLPALYPSYLTPNVAFRNKGNLTFEDVSQKWGFTMPDISWGMSLADFDNDGDLDIITNRLNESSGVYRNESSAPRVAIRLRGLPPNTQGIGSKIRVMGGPTSQSKEVIGAGTYLSSSDPLTVFAAGRKEMRIEVSWRSGKQSVISDVKANHIYEIFEPSDKSNEQIEPRAPIASTPFYEDVSYLLKHEHHEDVYDDFGRQPLLPNRLSQMGPGITWYDMDRDGDEELVVTSGKGGGLALFQNDGQGKFHQAIPVSVESAYDQTVALGWSGVENIPNLLVGYSNYENTIEGKSFVKRIRVHQDQVMVEEQVAETEFSIGPMSMSDYDNDGDLDLFVGGRSLPGRYPEAASSKLYRNEGGTFTLDQNNSRKFEFIGMVSGSVFSDLDGDGDGDLILAVEWGPVMIFRNNNGQFTEVTEALGMDKYRGLWNGVTTGDIDGDGRLDIIATNWGLNNEYPASMENPLRLYYDDFDNNGTLDIIEGHFNPMSNQVVPERGLATLFQAIPYIRSRVPNHNRFSESSVLNIIGNQLLKSQELQVNTLEHMVFFNQVNGFKAVSMPLEAQFSPAFYAGVTDFDGDGYEDIFLSQNFFATALIKPRSDGGRGLWLKGDGKGALNAVPGQVSGIKVYGEQRGAALGDYDRDGRVDLAVSQNGAETKLYHNVGGQQGLRVSLLGPPGNINGVGAMIRLVYGNGYGPAREVHSGSGYWSQDAMVQVMGVRGDLKGIWIRWPGGRILEVALPSGVMEITISHDGVLTANPSN